MATPQTFDVLSETWTDYDGDNTYGDFTVTAGVVTDGTGYELGLAQINRPTPTTFDTLYAHNDHLGTLRGQSNSTGFTSFPVHTAFGEDMTDLGQRLAYAGAFGYETATSDTPCDAYTTNFTALHVGARYYDPSTGRFLQRDPLGIRGRLNVYQYASNRPTVGIDPSGLMPIDGVAGIHEEDAYAGGCALANAMGCGVCGELSTDMSSEMFPGSEDLVDAVFDGVNGALNDVVDILTDQLGKVANAVNDFVESVNDVFGGFS